MSSVLVIYSWPRLWSMGTGRGSPDFYHSLLALTRTSDEVRLVCPRDKEMSIAGQVPPGVKVSSFSWPRLPLVPAPRGPRAIRVAVFCLNWPVRMLNFLSFNISASRTAHRECESLERLALVSAHGFMGARAAASLAARFDVPLTVRLFGVSLGIRGFSWPVLAAQFEERAAFRVNAARWIIADDGSGGRRAAKKLGVPQEKVSMIRAAVQRRKNVPDLEKFRLDYRKRLGLTPEAKIVLRVCRLWSQQRVERLIESLPSVTADGAPVVAVIVGEGDERERLESLAAMLNKRVIFTGALPNSELTEHYRAADLYLATADRTNLSQSVLEAMSHGLAVLALDTGETASLIVDLKNGRLIPAGHAGELADAVRELLDDNSLRGRLAAGAVSTAEAVIPDPEGRIGAEAELYSRLISTD
jgi:glycosyltransferase involved in cell wall biosynthesis